MVRAIRGNSAVNIDDEIECIMKKADVCFHACDYNGALSHYARVVSSGRPYPIAVLMKGASESNIGMYGAAIADFNDYVRCYPESAIGYALRAAAKYAMHCHESAIVDCNSVIRIGYQHRDKPDGKMKTCLERLSDVHPGMRVIVKFAYRIRGSANAKLNRYEESGLDFVKADSVDADEAVMPRIEYHIGAPPDLGWRERRLIEVSLARLQ